MSILDIIDGYGNSYPEKVALKNRDNSMTYRELLDKSNSIANFLICNYGHDNTPIIVYGHKELDMITCFIGCVKAGHPYIPTDSSLPSERVEDIVKNSGTKIILANEKLENISNVIVLNSNEINAIYREYGKQVDLSYRVNGLDTYYIIYTSGSTGKPKGVKISMNSLESFVKWGLKLCNMKIEENNQVEFLNQAPLSFDLSVMDTYLSLVSGSTLCLVDKYMIINMKELFDFFRKSNIGIWVSTPSFMQMCLSDKNFDEKLLPNLKKLLFCGEVLPNGIVEKIYQRFTNSNVINTYGPTEATVAVTSLNVNENILKEFNPLPVGYVKDECFLLIKDSQGNILHDGQKGEIYILGESVSTGYFNNEENTKKCFSIEKYKENYYRCYKTGDEGYIKEGMLFYSGRVDFQIKLNGYRIELEDIENNLRKVPFIENGVIAPFYKDNKIQYLIGVVKLNRDLEETPFRIGIMIKDELSKVLPSYMVPRKFIIKNKIPITNNGKVDRKMILEEIL